MPWPAFGLVTQWPVSLIGAIVSRKGNTMSYVEPYILTKMDVAALRQADRLCVHLDGDVGQVRAIKECRASEKRPFARDIEHSIEAPVSLHMDYGQESGNVRCFAYVSLYQSQKTPATSIINTLRAGDGIRFTFHADYHQTQALAERTGFHADTLMLKVFRGAELHAQFELANVTCEDNTARMVKGVYAKREVAA
jgi:hypothetical protein